LNDANWYTELAERNAHVDAGLVGVLWGLVVGQHYTGTFATPNLSVDVSLGAARDDAGWRLPVDVIANVLCDVDHLGAATAVAAGHHRALSIFVQFEDQASEVHSIKSGGNAYRIHDDGVELLVYMGAETLLANPLDLPPLMAGYVLLADVTLVNGQTQIVPGDISTARRQDLLGDASPATPNSVRGFSPKAAILAILGWFNTLLANLASIGAGTTDDGATYIGAKGYAGVPDALTVGTVRSQLTELNVSVNSRARIAGETFNGAVSATTLGSTVGAVTAKTAVIPTAGKDIQLVGDTNDGRIQNAATALKPLNVGVATGADHALTSRWVGRASAKMTTPLNIAKNGECAFAFDTEEYDSADLWAVANGDRMVAPVAGYYHVSLWGQLISGAVTLDTFYVALRHSADARMLACGEYHGTWGAVSADAHAHCGIDVYLTVGQYVYAVAYQTNSVDVLTVIGRMTMHRFA
jgi:hypothetical protein